MTTISLSRLTPWPHNVRKTGAREGIDELAASIAAHGLLQSLVVRKAARGKFAVVAGQRRLLALTALAERGQIPSDLPVECHIVDADADGAEIGLAENVVRHAMHPADQFEAFAALLAKESSIADVAARFGVSEAIVTRRMRLGRVSPVLLDAYRSGTLNLEQVQAFAVSDDHAAQERVWDGLGDERCYPSAIRQALTEDEIPATDKRVRYIGLDAYEAAGGAVRRDLFDNGNAGYILDTALLGQLVQDALDRDADAIRAEGWKWVEPRLGFGYAERGDFDRCTPEEVPLTEAEQAELDSLEAEQAQLLQEEDDGDDAENSATIARLEAIETRIDDLTQRPDLWTAEHKAVAGAVVYLSGDGNLIVERGLIRPEDAPEQESAPWDDEPETAPSPAQSLPAKLVADLTAQRTAALRAALAEQPDVALVAVTHALARQAFYSDGGKTCLGILPIQRSLIPSLAQPDDCSGLTQFDADRNRWLDRLPGDGDALWDWCLRQTQDRLLHLLAIAAAHTVDAVHGKGTREDTPRLLHADALARALQFDMHAWFTPTTENYFGRINRTAIMDALVEAGRPTHPRSWAKLRKGELAALAEREIAGTGWLPLPLRRITDTVQADEAAADRHAALAA
jgi:ParB family chromosome partitioning protein